MAILMKSEAVSYLTATLQPLFFTASLTFNPYTCPQGRFSIRSRAGRGPGWPLSPTEVCFGSEKLSLPGPGRGLCFYKVGSSTVPEIFCCS